MEIFTFKDGVFWIAAWRRYDIVEQGSTEIDAINRLWRAIANHALSDAAEGLIPLSTCPQPPAEVIATWEENHKRCHPLN